MATKTLFSGIQVYVAPGNRCTMPDATLAHLIRPTLAQDRQTE